MDNNTEQCRSNAPWITWYEWDYIVDSGIVYIYGGGIEAGTALIVGSIEEAGKNISLPESIFNGDEKLTVAGFMLLPNILFKEGAKFDWTTHQVKKLHLSKNVDLPSYYSYDPETLFFSDKFSGLEELSVDPDNPKCFAYDGCGYVINSDNTHSLAIIPPRKKLPEIYRLKSSTTLLIDGSISGVENLETLIIPENVNYIGREAISWNPNLKQIIFEGENIEGNLDVLVNNPKLRSIDFQKPVKEPLGLYFNNSPDFVKLNLKHGTEKISSRSFLRNRIMHFNLPDVKIVGEQGLGVPQSVLIGDKVNDDSKCGLDPLWLYNQDYLTHVYIKSMTPPDVGISNKLYFKKSWTAYVPAEAIELYRAHPYWSQYYNIEPITDKLIPLVSEPELEIEPGETHEYLWDVMPLGHAVPKESGTWSSSNPEVATIDNNGVLTAITPGETTIMFYLESTDGETYTAESKVTVKIDYMDDIWTSINSASQINSDTFYILTALGGFSKIMCINSVGTYTMPGSDYLYNFNSKFIYEIPGNAALLKFIPARTLDSSSAADEYIISVWDTMGVFVGYLYCPSNYQITKSSSQFTPATLTFYTDCVAIQFRNNRILQYSANTNNFKPYDSFVNGGDIMLYSNATTGIEEIVEDVTLNCETTGVTVPDGVYNLYGQRVADDIEGLDRGLYIRVKSGLPEKILK